MKNVLVGAIALALVLSSTSADACRCREKRTQAANKAKSGAGHGSSCGSGCGSSCGGACSVMTAKPEVTRDTHAIPSQIEWLDLETALTRAREDDRLLLVQFSFGKQCQHCLNLERGLFRNPAVTEMLNAGNGVIPVRVPLWAITPAERAFGEKVEYDEDCLLTLVDATGEVVRSKSGQRFSTRGLPSAEALVAMLSQPG